MMRAHRDREVGLRLNGDSMRIDATSGATVGIVEHGNEAVAVTVGPGHQILDRRTIALTKGLPHTPTTTKAPGLSVAIWRALGPGPFRLQMRSHWLNASQLPQPMGLRRALPPWRQTYPSRSTLSQFACVLCYRRRLRSGLHDNRAQVRSGLSDVSPSDRKCRACKRLVG
jgi:hypothetical protein